MESIKDPKGSEFKNTVSERKNSLDEIHRRLKMAKEKNNNNSEFEDKQKLSKSKAQRRLKEKKTEQNLSYL